MVDEVPKPADAVHPTVATYALVGTVATTWSLLERSIDAALWRMTGLDSKTGACLTSQIQSVRLKLIALEALAHLQGASEGALKAIRRFQQETEAPARKRNMVVHNPILANSPNPDGPMLLARVSADRKSISEFQPLPPQEIQAIQNEIAVLLVKFGNLMNEHILPLRASRETPQPPPAPTPGGHPQGEQNS